MRALITGVLGQDGSYLAEQLAEAGHDVWGMVRRPRPDPPGVHLLAGDLLDQASLEDVLRASRPDEVYNLAAVTSPGGAWGTAQPPLLADVTGLGVVRLLDAMLRVCPDAHLVHASSSAIYDPHRYGLYGIAKRFAHDAVTGYRHRLHASNAVLFSHTSPKQDHRFLARRICSAAARIKAGSGERLMLGDVESRRDWGYAPDYVAALPLIARQSAPGDHVIATGRSRTVRELVETAFTAVGMPDALITDVVQVDPTAPRIPDEIHPDAADARLASGRALDWKPRTSFVEMVGLMVAAAP